MTKEKHFEKLEDMINVFGQYDANIAHISKAFDVAILASGESVKISGETDDVKKAYDALCILEGLSKREHIIPAQVHMAIELASAGKTIDPDELSKSIAVTQRGRVIRAKTYNQKLYVDAIKNNSIVFGVGPAGTGKTYLAVALAVAALKSGETNRIILTRPAVEAGEKLGFLPGDLSEKVDPYLRPLYDALKEFLGDEYIKYIERGDIEIAPLAYMRGRTLSGSFIILDEAQNSTREQMKMFLTRIGENSKMVVTGDITQIDLPKPSESGMSHAIEVLEGVKDIKTVWFSSKDVVRRELVSRIIEAYAAHGKSKKEDEDDKKDVK